MDVVVVHSPLVGPAVVEPLASALRESGWRVSVPDLRTAIGSASAFARAAAEVAEHADVVIGHSGAGAFLPLVAEAARATAVFVDALVPGPTSPLRPSGPFIELVDALPVADGRLPPWNEWWPPEVMVELVPDDELRRRLTAELPRVPRSFYDEPVAVPDRWFERPNAYLQLSPAYDDDHDRAAAWGWPTRRLDGRHLDLCVHPGRVAEQVSDLLGDVR